MKYSTAFRANILKKVLPPENRSVLEVSRENGLSTQTIYTWLKRAKDGTLEGSTSHWYLKTVFNKTAGRRRNKIPHGRHPQEDLLSRSQKLHG